MGLYSVLIMSNTINEIGIDDEKNKNDQDQLFNQSNKINEEVEFNFNESEPDPIIQINKVIVILWEGIFRSFTCSLYGFTDYFHNLSIGPSDESLISMGSTSTEKLVIGHQILTNSSKVFRLVTPIFLNVGLSQLFLNILCMLLVFPIEIRFGKWIFGSLYMVSGIGASVLANLLDIKNTEVCSTAPLYGVCIALYLEMKLHNFHQNMVSISKVLLSTITLLVFINSVSLFEYFPAYIGGGICGGLMALVVVIESNSTWRGIGASLLIVNILIQNQVYRFVTPFFINANFFHLLLNMIGLFTMYPLEKQNGKLWFGGFLFVSAFGSNIFSHLYNYNGASVGCSGAVLGIVVARFVNVLIEKETYSQSAHFNTISVLIFIMFLTFTNELIQFSDWAGHFGGFIVGAMIGAIWTDTMFTKTRSIGILFLLFAIYPKRIFHYEIVPK
ncbi:hypothetical protein PPL_08025 [Heterostelium album PN500]|uniref:rhomboid protease n=1 Tax=Heterostelium pallidum (strain ATCC 26659 / Pp 5 / PN500) TaxID=670386 RepID=D3BHM2_HETP5|nr:hypothetical protein PPL_08025 [Heterostelium album PN500]EFA79199.1 hypothetical protein PPL_08025 [Heterostelium album PN500]|eukprot:XP_020431320.1 hypothetical protein PPL_08025 [Heterostelium album PN500]